MFEGKDHRSNVGLRTDCKMKVKVGKPSKFMVGQNIAVVTCHSFLVLFVVSTRR